MKKSILDEDEIQIKINHSKNGFYYFLRIMAILILMILTVWILDFRLAKELIFIKEFILLVGVVTIIYNNAKGFQNAIKSVKHGEKWDIIKIVSLIGNSIWIIIVLVLLIQIFLDVKNNLF